MVTSENETIATTATTATKQDLKYYSLSEGLLNIHKSLSSDICAEGFSKRADILHEVRW